MFDITLLPGFAATEKGNILLERDGDWLAYCSCGVDTWLEISVRPGNYPVFSARTLKQTEEELATHIQTHCEGWTALKLSIKEVKVDVDSFVIGPEGTCPSCSENGVR